MTSKFYLTQDEYKKLYSDGAIFNTGLEMNEMEGIWLAWETDPEAIKALLPPCSWLCCTGSNDLHRKRKH